MAGLFHQDAQSQPGAEHMIRKFSAARRLTIAEDDANGTLLNEAVIVHLESPDEADPTLEDYPDGRIAVAVLEKKMEELEVSRQRFLKYLNSHQRSNLDKASNTTEAILATIDSATFEWCRRRDSGTGVVSALKKKFHQTCRSLDQHAVLFSILPKEHEFVSVFYGSLNSIVAASVMNQTMAEGLPKIVDELNAVVKVVARKISLYREAKQQMERVVIDLYIHVFELLAKLMKWYSKNNHGFKVFKKDCYSDFEADLRKIHTWANLIENEVLANLVLEGRQAHGERRRFEQKMQKVSDRLEKYFETQENAAMQQAVQKEKVVLTNPALQYEQFAELIVSKLSQEFKILGATQTATLRSIHAATALVIEPSSTQVTAGAEHRLGLGHADTGTVERSLETIVSSVQKATLERSSSAESSPQSREDIEFHSRFLDDWFPDDHVRPFQLRQGPPSQLPLHEPVAARLSQWIRESDSQILCIQYPYNPGQVSIGSRLASYVVSTALEVEQPIISYFCSLPREGIPGGRSMQTVAMCEMVASLIRQMIVLLPSHSPESATRLSKERFQSLDGTFRTWEPMLSIFADLLSLVSQNLLIVLHGLQLLDSAHTDAPIKELLDVVGAQIRGRENQSTGIVKALFVTEGQARAVVPWLKRGEHLICEDSQGHRGW